MSRRERGAVLFRGRTIPFDVELSATLGSTDGALALQQLHYHGLDSPDGWVRISVRQLAAELGCDHNHADSALKLLVDEFAVIEAEVQPKKAGRYRVLYDALHELLPHRKWGSWVESQTDELSGIQTDSPIAKRVGGASLLAARARPDQNRKEQTRPTTSNEGGRTDLSGPPKPRPEETVDVERSLAGALRDAPIGSHANGSGKGVQGQEKAIYPPEVLAVLAHFTSEDVRARMGAFWRKPRGEGLDCATTPEAMAQLHRFGTGLLERKVKR